MRILAFLILLGFSTLSAGQAYRWVDENGVTHYSNVPPPASEKAPVEKKDVAEASRRTSEQPRHDRARSDNHDAPRSGNDSGESQSEGLDCEQAVEYARYSVEQSLEVGRRNRDDGYMDDEDYERGRERLRQLENRISVQHCKRARGSDRAFYSCMEDGHSPALFCVNETRPDFAR